MLNYSQLRVLAIITTILSAGLLAVHAADADILGLTPRILAWLSIVAGMIAVGQGFLPDVRGTATDPTFIKNRIRELPPEDRLQLAQELADQAVADAQARAMLAATRSELPISPPQAPL